MLQLMNCASASRVISAEEKYLLDEIMGREFWEFKANYAFPQMSKAYVIGTNEIMARAGSSLSQINLSGGDYFMRIELDSIHAYLPYYGEWDNFYEPGSTGLIELNAPITDFHKEIRKNTVQLKLRTRRKTERLNITLKINGQGKGKLLVLSGQRDPIRYEGGVE